MADGMTASNEMPASAQTWGGERFRRTPSWMIGQLSIHGYRLLTEQFAAENTKPYEYRVLASLADGGPASQAVLGRRSGIHLSDLVATLNTLADRGHIRRDPDPADRRRNIITLTEDGYEHLARLDVRLAAAQDALLAALPPADRGTLTELLQRALAGLDARTGPL
ncbi:DNA-binding MarR family transcriptional regulator [Catenuloplanes nepalensis]|uniref:DNA-binding MarR family transcriptional regulator n=1 Tax=Catenuloplanes nepalensis TaxID=587533 RepID=A0ABT9MKU8_9ACTN|nr:MarR family transcriptional regulator [Catenuloplanes nepalensis]MDP9792035.1 DNA-binding MarR family transcriptional regulator [Catenuloplanes nepalensis]